MRNRLLKTLALLAAIGVAGIAVIEISRPRPRIDAESLSQIQPGMTVAQVEAIIGAPAGDYGFGDVYHAGVWLDESKVWKGQDLAIVVFFDDNGLVTGSLRVRIFRPYDSLWDKLLQKLGLREERFTRYFY